MPVTICKQQGRLWLPRDFRSFKNFGSLSIVYSITICPPATPFAFLSA